MKVLMSFAILVSSISSISSWAGDGGFDLWTCTSNSGRTNLTVYVDNYSGAKIPARVVFGIDGQFLTYEHYRYDIDRAEEEVCQDDCTQINFQSGKVTVSNGDFINMSLDLKDKRAVIAQGYVDPRPDYRGSQGSAISLTCKQFHQSP